MRLLLLISLSLLLAWTKADAQLAPDADEFFNGGAQLYISNNIPAALERTENGLKLYPNDVKLKKLEALLKQQQQQQSQSQQNQQNQSSQNQQNQSQSNPQKNQQSPPQNSGSRQNQPQPNQSQPNQPQNKSGQEEKQQPSAAPEREMTPEQAKKLLDAQKGDEQILQMKPPGQPENQNQPIKDW